LQAPKEQEPRCNNVKTLGEHGIQSLFHFTDGFESRVYQEKRALALDKISRDEDRCKVQLLELSHKLDTKKGLADFVRLSFCKKHPMMYIALKEKRISVPVVLEIKLEVVSRPGVLFCAINAAAKAAKASESPHVARFDVVKAPYQRAVDESLRPFYQGEVLVPDWIPPHLIKIPKVDAFANCLELRGRLPDSDLAECTSKGECGGLVKASEPKPHVLPTEVLSVGDEKSSHETFAAPKTSRRIREVPWASNLLTELKRERKERFFSLVDPHHVLQCAQFACDLDKDVAFISKRATSSVEKPVDGIAGRCQMPLSRSASCEDCIRLGSVYNCPKHMKQCHAPAWVACASPHCLRLLCWEHVICYCETGTVGRGGAAERERKRSESERDSERSRRTRKQN